MSPRVIVRPAVPDDAELIVHFVRELARFEKEPAENVRITEHDVLRDAFGTNPRFDVLIAELDDVPVGFALFFHNYSTWTGRPGIYVEDIFVEERVRKLSVGRRLMAAIARIARSRGCERIDLSVLDWNPARGFYRRLGFRHIDQWQPFRLQGDALNALADESDEYAIE
ncbi:MAG TPA: GNAT family N-acetyltransferase [Candidatus Binataceae bacterium]|nr:GNAT family N-acetyltransferase [Candidatus Binataceae bacterium]